MAATHALPSSAPLHRAGRVGAGLAAAILAILATPARAGTLITLHQFTGGADGADPGGPLLRDTQGNLYGTAQRGGGGNGVVFELHAQASPPWPLTVLADLPPGPKAGTVNPGLAADAAGALYGSTFAFAGGGLFRLTPPAPGATHWNFQPIHAFGGANSPLGAGATGVPVVDAAGDVTGVTQSGGDQAGFSPCQCGVAYTLPHASQAELLLYTFRPVPHPSIPVAGLTAAGPNLFYGTSSAGGVGQCYDGSGVVVIGCGTVYRLQSFGGAWVETTLHQFTAAEGNTPVDPVTLGPDGALYGYANLDVYRLAQNASGLWHKRTIYRFPGGIGGTAPTGAPVFDAQGNLYGLTRAFGVAGYGIAFRLAPPAMPGLPWTETALATVAPDYDAPQPVGGLVLAPDGTLYGAASSFGSGAGSVFEIIP